MLVTRQKINTINRKQNSSYTKQYSNQYGLTAFSYGGQPPIPALPIKDRPVYSECSLVGKQLHDPWRLQNEHSAQQNTKVE
jgi:hypothetical protein